MLYIKKANMEDSLKQWEFASHMESENGYENHDYNISYEEYCSVSLPAKLEHSQGINLKPGYVPDTTYYLWLDNTVIGEFHFRHILNDFLRNGPGHIGYGILKEYRGKGYMSQGLALLLKETKDLIAEDEFYLSCNLDNKASLKVQQNNGAYIHHSDDKENFTRIPKNVLK